MAEKGKHEEKGSTVTHDDARLPEGIITPEALRMTAGVRPMPVDAPKAGYTEFTWSGVLAYQCSGCPYSSTEEADVVTHVAAVHPWRGDVPLMGAAVVAPTPPVLSRGGVVKAVFDDSGQVTGFEEVKDAKS